MPTRRTERQLFQPGELLAGRYQIDRVLGRGGFAEVYLAHHAEVDSLQVAIKVLHANQRTREQVVGRFRREARLLALLRNRHTVRLVDFGFADDGVGYLVMEYVRGAALDRVVKTNGPLRDTDVARVGIGVLKALDEAHSIGVIHRDLKPANIILVNEPGERHAIPRVLDFGIAKVLGVADAFAPTVDEPYVLRSRADVVFCTPLYAAPELLRGRPDFRTDLYALGLVMAEMLDGHPPYPPEECAKLESPHLWKTPIPLGERCASSGLRHVIERACAKRLDERYASAVEMLADLEIAYEAVRVPEYQEEPLRIVPAPPPEASGPRQTLADSSQFVPVSALPKGAGFESIAPYDSEATQVVPPKVEVDPSVHSTGEPSSPEGLASHLAPRPISTAAPEAALAAPTTSTHPQRSGGAWIAFLVLFLAGGVLLARSLAPGPEPASLPAPPPAPTPAAAPDVVVHAQPLIWAAHRRAIDAPLVVRTSAAAEVRIDGVPVGEARPERALVLAGPTHRPYVIEALGEDLRFTRVVRERGPALLDVVDAGAGSAAQEAERQPATRREPARPRPRPRPPIDPTPAAPSGAEADAPNAPSLLGPPIRPRTQ